jgi:hypothetical protein
MNYGKTNLNQSYPWGLHHRAGSRVLTSDGKIRALAYLAQTADTFFSIPAAVRVKGKYITGYVTGEEAFTEDCKTTRTAYAFRSHDGQEGNHLPPWPPSFSPELFELLKDGQETTTPTR